MAHAPGAPAPPLHLHRQTDEAIYVASGRLTTDIDGEQTTHEEGSFALIRRGQKHTFWNPGEDTARYLRPGDRGGCAALQRARPSRPYPERSPANGSAVVVDDLDVVAVGVGSSPDALLQSGGEAFNQLLDGR
jgi:hypothetical protein